MAMRRTRKRYQLSGVFWKEGKHIVGKCPELGVSSFGRTVEEAKKRLGEAVELYLENAQALSFGVLGLRP